MSNEPPGGPDGAQKRKRTESSGSDVGIPAWIAGASPPRFVSLEELMNTAVGLDNMALAHEISVNSEFKLEPKKAEPGSIAARVSEAMHDVFWEKLTEDFAAQPPVYEHALVLLDELKENLLTLLLPHHTRLKSEIDERLDMDLFKQQSEHKCLDFRAVAAYILAVMGKLCAPVRDKKIIELKQLEDLISQFRGIFELLDLMKIDMANFTIASCRPVIQQNSVEYERQKFQAYLDANPDGLRHTQSWLARAVETWRNESVGNSKSFKPSTSSTVPTNEGELGTMAQKGDKDNEPSTSGLTPQSPPARSLSDITAIAYWELLEWSDNRAFPETLLVDQARLYDMRNKCFQLIVTTSAVMVASNMAGRPVGESMTFRTQLKNRIMILLEDCEQRSLPERLPSVSEEILKQIDKVSEGSREEKPLQTESKNKDALRAQILDLAQFAHPVRKLMRDRIRNFIRSVVTTPSASPIKLPHGLSLVQSELSKLTGAFLRLVSHNRQVFAQHYDRILETQLMAESFTEDSAASPDDSQSDVVSVTPSLPNSGDNHNLLPLETPDIKSTDTTDPQDIPETTSMASNVKAAHGSENGTT